MCRPSRKFEAVGWEQIQGVLGADLLEAEGTKWVEPTFLGCPVPSGASARNVSALRRTWGTVRVGGRCHTDVLVCGPTSSPVKASGGTGWL